MYDYFNSSVKNREEIYDCCVENRCRKQKNLSELNKYCSMYKTIFARYMQRVTVKIKQALYCILIAEIITKQYRVYREEFKHRERERGQKNSIPLKRL